MRDRLKHNLGLKVMAVLIAICLWWVVVNIDDPIMTQKYKVDVQVSHTEVITNIGKSYKIEDDMKSVVVTVKARRKVISEIRSSNIVAMADFRELQNDSIPIRVTISGFEGEYVEANANPQNLQIKTEDTIKKTFPITTRTTGEISDGYVLGELIAEPQTIDISGPKSLIGRISKVVAKVNVSELSETTELKAEVLYYDSADNVIDQTLLSSNCDKNGVKVKAQVLETKTVRLQFDTTGIEPASGYVFSSIVTEPQSIVVCGTEEQLKELQVIEIPAEALAQKNLSANTEVVVAIDEYLPEGIARADEEANGVVVSILVEEAGTKSIMIPVRSIVVENSSEKFELTLGPEQEVELRFSGLDEDIQALTLENITAYIDLKDIKKAGTYRIPVQIKDMPSGCTYIGTATVQIILEEH